MGGSQSQYKHPHKDLQYFEVIAKERNVFVGTTYWDTEAMTLRFVEDDQQYLENENVANAVKWGRVTITPLGTGRDMPKPDRTKESEEKKHEMIADSLDEALQRGEKKVILPDGTTMHIIGNLKDSKDPLESSGSESSENSTETKEADTTPTAPTSPASEDPAEKDKEAKKPMMVMHNLLAHVDEKAEAESPNKTPPRKRKWANRPNADGTIKK